MYRDFVKIQKRIKKEKKEKRWQTITMSKKRVCPVNIRGILYDVDLDEAQKNYKTLSDFKKRKIEVVDKAIQKVSYTVFASGSDATLKASEWTNIVNGKVPPQLLIVAPGM